MTQRNMILVLVGAVALWAAAMVLVPSGPTHGFVQAAGLPGVFAALLVARRFR